MSSWRSHNTFATDTSLHGNETSFHKDLDTGHCDDPRLCDTALSNRIDVILMDWFILRLYGVALLCMMVMMWFCF